MRAGLRQAVGIALVLLLGACAKVSYRPGGPIPPAATQGPGRYEALPGRSADVIAELRAAPPPVRAEMSDGAAPAGDEHFLADKGYVHVGDGYYAGAVVDARAWLADKAREIGADKAMLYPDGDATLHAAYYVRFRLPFGASFRDLHADERETAGGSGVRLGAVIGNSPASEANLRDGDIVLKLNGEPIQNRADFERRLRAHMGQRVTLTISRNGALSSRMVRLGVLASEMDGRK